MKIVFGNVLRAEHRAKGTGGALDQSGPAMSDAPTVYMSPHLDKHLTKQHIFLPNWPGRAWPARLTQLAC